MNVNIYVRLNKTISLVAFTTSKSTITQKVTLKRNIWRFGGLTRQWRINDRPSHSFWIFWGLLLQILIAKCAYTYNTMLTIRVSLSTLITKTHRFVIVKNKKKSQTLRILRCSNHAPSSEYFWIRHSMMFYFI